MIADYDNVDCEDFSQGLKYPAPDVSTLAMKDFLSQQEINVLMKHLPVCDQYLNFMAGELISHCGEVFDDDGAEVFVDDGEDDGTVL